MKPKQVEVKSMKWSDYFWSEGGWVGWIFVYWWILGQFVGFQIPYIAERLGYVDKIYLFIFFVIAGLILSKSAVHYRKKWNDRFKELKNQYFIDCNSRHNEANNIASKIKLLMDGKDSEEGWKDLVKMIDEHSASFDCKKIQQLKGDSDYET